MDIRVTNFNYYDDLGMAAKLTISGSGSDIKDIYITGVK